MIDREQFISELLPYANKEITVACDARFKVYACGSAGVFLKHKVTKTIKTRECAREIYNDLLCACLDNNGVIIENEN